MFGKWKYIYAVYEHKSFTKAAEALYISQPSLSAAVKKTETMLGSPLFERGSGTVKLTEVGRAYISAAEQMKQIENNFTKSLNDLYHLDSGDLVVGGTNYISSHVLPKIINRFSRLHPKINVTPVEGNSLRLQEMIENERIDIVIDSFSDKNDSYEKTPLAKETVLLCVPKERPINKTLGAFAIDAKSIADGSADYDRIGSVEIGMFADEDFILLKHGHVMHECAMRIFEEADFAPHILFSVDQLNISYALAQEGMGICFVTDLLIRYERSFENVVFYKTEGKAIRRELYVAIKKNRYCSRAMREFISIARETIGDGAAENAPTAQSKIIS